MAQYHYIAVAADGRRVKGTMEAGGSQELLTQLSAKQLHCLQYENLSEQRSTATTYHMRTKEIVVFCRQIETMLAAGITISRAFNILYEKTDKPKMKRLYQNIYESIQKGNPLSAAMQEQGKSFPALLIHMIASGETSGTLDRVTKRMSVHFNNEMKLANKLRVAMIYPAILLSVSIAVVILLFTAVLPRLFGMFAGAELPASTKFLMSLSELMVNDWAWLLLGLAVIIGLIAGVAKTERGKLFFDTAKLKIPKLGKLMRIVYTARFANSMATLYSSGIPMMRALEISCEILSNTYYEHHFVGVIERVGSGQSLASAAEVTPLFDSMFISLIYIGEEAGTLDQVLQQASDYYDVEAQTALEQMVAMLEPAMIVVLAIVIGFIVASVILPIYGMYGQIA